MTLKKFAPQKRGTAQLFDVEKDQTPNRFAQHFNQLLNVEGSVDPLALDCFPNLPQIDSLHEPPMFDE